MDTIFIRGGTPLRGRVPISGSKNAALPILIATLLSDGPSLVGNLPDIQDVRLTLQILENMGATVERVDGATCRIDPRHAAPPARPDALTGRMRASAYLLGAGVGRFGCGRIGQVGGCDFGGRPIDQHIKALAALGAGVLMTEDEICATADALHGADICFDLVSVGATINAILAAVRADGESVLRNAACEPHVADLCRYLNSCGADIRGGGTGTIRIRGVPHLHGAAYGVIPDMIEAGTYLLAGAATCGAVSAVGVLPGHLRSLLSSLREMGADLDVGEHTVTLFAPHRLRGADIVTQPYPGFPTDLQPPFTAAVAAMEGECRIQENIWRHRFRYVEELRKMGADIRLCEESAAYVTGTPLVGADVHIPDLRAGAALMIAACAAEGRSVLHGAAYVERGYEDILGKWRALGAEIRAE